MNKRLIKTCILVSLSLSLINAFCGFNVAVIVALSSLITVNIKQGK